MIDQSQVTVVIPHLGSTKEQVYALDECVKSLEETCSCSIIIATNGPTLPAYGHAASIEDHRHIHVFEQGQCKAVNAAVATVNTPWILVTNDDMIFPTGWFEKLISNSIYDRLCSSPQLVEPRPGAPTFLTHFCGGAGGDFDKQKFYEFSNDYSGEEFRTGFNLPFLMKKELWDLVGGYDINYDPWGSNSDSDLEYKIKLAGVQSYQNTNCLVYHFSQTSGTFSPEHQDAWQKNWQYFIDKWGFPRAESPEIWEANFEIPKENKYHPWWEGFYK